MIVAFGVSNPDRDKRQAGIFKGPLVPGIFSLTTSENSAHVVSYYLFHMIGLESTNLDLTSLSLSLLRVLFCFSTK